MPGTADAARRRRPAGADLVGGIDPCAFDRDPVAHLDVVFGVAERHGVGVDIHLHETGELGAFTFELIAERTAALGMRGQVTISHAFALSSVDRDRQAALVDLLAANDIALATVAPGNREPLPLETLRDAGVRVGLGQDGIRDFWSPYGNGDVLDRASAAGVPQRLPARRARRAVRRRRLRGGGRSIVDGTPWSPTAMLDDSTAGLAPAPSPISSSSPPTP